MIKKFKLGVNIDHVATLRQARGTDYPDVVQAAKICEKAGAHGITVHLREDRRHIQDRDIYALRNSIKTALNLELANNPDVVAVALDTLPDEACVVPEKRRELTTEGGLDVAGNLRSTAKLVNRLSSAGIKVSLFIAPDIKQVKAAAETGAKVIELHTGTYCEKTGARRKTELNRLYRAAQLALDLGIQVNAGHGLTLENVTPILKIPGLDTLNIGHSIVAHAVFVGLENAVKEMLKKINRG